jgi:uncharacterized membrane protein (UPF0127 family)
MVVRNVLSFVLSLGLGALLLILTFGYFFDDVRNFVMRDTETNTIYINGTPFTVRIADTQPERAQGLSGTEPLGRNEGMLFIFDESDYYGFWMKDMNYPIDILWFDASRRLVHLETDVRPDSYPTSYAPDEPARYVVELAAYTADSFQFQEGALLTLPAGYTQAVQ